MKNFNRETEEEKWWGKSEYKVSDKGKVGWEKERVKAQEWLRVPLPGVLTSCALTSQSAHLSLHCLTFPLNYVGTEAIPFFPQGSEAVQMEDVMCHV